MAVTEGRGVVWSGAARRSWIGMVRRGWVRSGKAGSGMVRNGSAVKVRYGLVWPVTVSRGGRGTVRVVRMSAAWHGSVRQ